MRKRVGHPKKQLDRVKKIMRLPPPGKGNMGEVGRAVLASMTLLEGRASFSFR
jgi:hypothetical protein